MNKALIVFFIFNSFQYSFTQNINYKEGDTLNVFALSGLKLRYENNVNSQVMRTMKFGEKVVVMDTFQFDKGKIQVIEGFSGHWIKVKYDTLEGYAFDGFLSGLPAPKMNYKKQKKQQENEFEGYEMCDILDEYINKEFYSIGKPIKKSNGIDGEQFHSSETQKISRGLTKILHNGWEWSSTELQMPNIRLSELKNLINVLADRSGLRDEPYEELKNNLRKLSEKNASKQVVFGNSWLVIIIKKYSFLNENQKWSIEFMRIAS